MFEGDHLSALARMKNVQKDGEQAIVDSLACLENMFKRFTVEAEEEWNGSHSRLRRGVNEVHKEVLRVQVWRSPAHCTT